MSLLCSAAVFDALLCVCIASYTALHTRCSACYHLCDTHSAAYADTVFCLQQDEEAAVPAIDKFFKNTWNAQRPMPKAPPQGTPHQPPASWQGNKPMYGYGAPVVNIPPEHLQYWQQYQQQRMLHHLQQQQQHHYQQQVQHAARHQQRGDQQPLPASAPPPLHAQYNLPQLQQQPSQRQRPAMMPTANGHADPPARVASPFATHARTASSSSLLQPGPPDAAAETLTPLPVADAAAAAAAEELEDQAEEHKSIASRNGSPEPSQKQGATASVSAPPVPAEALLHHISQVPSALPGDSSLLPNPSQQAFSSSMPASAAMANHAPSSLPPSAADGTTAGQVVASGPGAPANLAASSAHSVPASHLQQLPASLMASMSYPVQGYGMPLHSVNGRDMYQYGGLMVPMMPPGMMLLPPPQQQQQHQSRGGRTGRGSNTATNGSGGLELVLIMCRVDYLSIDI